MKLYHIFTGELGVNSYFLVTEEGRGAVIDPGEDAEAVFAFAAKKGFTLENCYLTHGHFDHMGCCKALQDAGVKIYVSQADAEKLYTDKNDGALFGHKTEPVHADFTFNDGDVLDFYGFLLRVMATPGHPAGSVCFLTELGIFSGDTLFYESVGRTDLSDGNDEDMARSLKKLVSLKGNFTVYPGHGRATTLEHEKEFNPYL